MKNMSLNKGSPIINNVSFNNALAMHHHRSDTFRHFDLLSLETSSTLVNINLYKECEPSCYEALTHTDTHADTNTYTHKRLILYCNIYLAAGVTRATFKSKALYVSYSAKQMSAYPLPPPKHHPYRGVNHSL